MFLYSGVMTVTLTAFTPRAYAVDDVVENYPEIGTMLNTVNSGTAIIESAKRPSNIFTDVTGTKEYLILNQGTAPSKCNVIITGVDMNDGVGVKNDNTGESFTITAPDVLKHSYKVDSTYGRTVERKINEQRERNLLPFPYEEYGKVDDGITFTVQDDGGIHVSGTATANASFDIVLNAFHLPIGNYVYSINTLMVEGAGIIGEWYNGSTWISSAFTSNIGQGYLSSGTFQSVNEQYEFSSYIYVSSGVTIDTVVYPQIETGSVVSDYEPIAMQDYMADGVKSGGYITLDPAGRPYREVTLTSSGDSTLSIDIDSSSDMIGKYVYVNGEWHLITGIDTKKIIINDTVDAGTYTDSIILHMNKIIVSCGSASINELKFDFKDTFY
jgi:hypothetical protein